MTGTTEAVLDLKVGGRRLRAGDVVKVTGEHGAEFRILRFDPAAGTVEVWGGSIRAGRRARRTFTVDRISTRLALAGTPDAETWQ